MYNVLKADAVSAALCRSKFKLMFMKSKHLFDEPQIVCHGKGYTSCVTEATSKYGYVAKGKYK